MKDIKEIYESKIAGYTNLNAQTKMIFLQGISNTGKSTVLKNLIKDFIKQGAVIKKQEEKFDIRNDVKVVLEYQNKIIGINTYGDDANFMNEGIKICNDYSCDVIFGAMRTKGETIEYVNLLRSITNKICIVKKMATEYSEDIQSYIDDTQLNVLKEIYQKI